MLDDANDLRGRLDACHVIIAQQVAAIAELTAHNANLLHQLTQEALPLLRRTKGRRSVMNKLDQLWEEVNALGGTVEDGDEYGRGVNETVGIVLDMIEKLGGMDPEMREQDRWEQRTS